MAPFYTSVMLVWVGTSIRRLGKQTYDLHLPGASREVLGVCQRTTHCGPDGLRLPRQLERGVVCSTCLRRRLSQAMILRGGHAFEVGEDGKGRAESSLIHRSH